jgi:hypothetical protein
MANTANSTIDGTQRGLRIKVKFRKTNGATRVMHCAALGTAPGRAKTWTAGRITDTVWTVGDVDVDDWRSINAGSIFAINLIVSV